MPIYKGSVKQKDIYIGSTKIGKVYKGSELVYQSKLPAGAVLFESATPGNYTLEVKTTQSFHIDLVGGGGGSVERPFFGWGNGGSASYIYGDVVINAGTYALHIGKGMDPIPYGGSAPTNDTNTTFLGNTAGGGSGAYGGTATVVTSGLTGLNGSNTTATGWINNYGAGGSNGSSGVNGYCKIVAV